MGTGVKDVQIVISAKDLATDMLKQIGGTLAAVFSIREVYEFGQAAVDAASAQEDAETKLAAALGRTSAALLTQASALQGTTKYSEEVVIAAQAQVAAFSKNEDVIRRVTVAATDFASAKGIDLVSASDLITKSIYGQINMLSRYGIYATGAAGSAERLSSVLQGLNDHFGGQAAAQAQTFSGSIAILKNSFSDLLIPIGNIITQNPAVMGAMGLLKDLFEGMGQSVKDNQVWLMELVQTGIAVFIRGMGLAVNSVYSFQLAWQLLETGVQAVIYGIVTALDWIMTPISYVMDKLVEMGAIKVNPLKGAADGISSYRDLVHDAMTQSANDVSATTDKMAKTSEMTNHLADVITNVEIPAVKASSAAVREKGDVHEHTAKQIAAQMAEEVGYLKTLAALYAVYGATKPEQQQMDLSIYDAETNAKIAAMKAQNSTAEEIHQEEINRAMGRQLIVEQQLQANETIMESMTRMAATYDMAAGIMEARQDLLNSVKQAGANIHMAADKAMQDQLLRLVEAHKFSATAIGQAILQQAKMEVLAIAAKSAVYGLFYTALGLGLLAMGDPRSGAAFMAAVDFGLIPGVAALSMATALNAISGPGAQAGAQGSNPSNPTYTSPVTSPTVAQQQQTQQITINVANGVGDKAYWDDLMENQVVPALNRAGDRNVQLTIQTA
jgi:hypothetical protein